MTKTVKVASKDVIIYSSTFIPWLTARKVRIIDYHPTHLSVLFQEHLIKYWRHPSFKLDVIVIGRNQIPYSVMTLWPEVATFEMKISYVGITKALNEVFFYSTSCCDQNVHLKDKLQANINTYYVEKVLSVKTMIIHGSDCGQTFKKHLN